MNKETKILSSEPIGKFEFVRYSSEMLELQLAAAAKKHAKGDKKASAYYVAIKAELERRKAKKAQPVKAKKPLIAWPKAPLFK